MQKLRHQIWAMKHHFWMRHNIQFKQVRPIPTLLLYCVHGRVHKRVCIYTACVEEYMYVLHTACIEEYVCIVIVSITGESSFC